jgi:predicted RecB family endonuclease
MALRFAGPKRTLELSGWSAPSGRPYKKVVCHDGIEARQARVYYPGTDDAPTRHVFGVKYESLEFEGRLRDRELGGAGGCTQKIEEIKQFVKDQQRVRFTWANVISVQGFISKFSPGRESTGECEYKLTLDVDVDDFADRKVTKVQRRAPDDYTSLIEGWVRAIDLVMPPDVELGGSVLDLADSLTNALQSTVGNLVNAANGISDFSKATLGQLHKIATLTTTIKTACVITQEAITSLSAADAVVREASDNNMKLWASQASVEDSMRQMAATSAAANRAARIAAAGKTRTTYAVQAGDTWESISSAFYGSPDRAVELQVANGLTGGPPAPGTTIRIPV